VDKGEGRKRIVIENVVPEIDSGAFPIKRVVGEKVVTAASSLQCVYLKHTGHKA